MTATLKSFTLRSHSANTQVTHIYHTGNIKVHSVSDQDWKIFPVMLTVFVYYFIQNYFFKILTFSVVLVGPISELWHTLIFFVASKPSSWFNNSSMVLCTSESPPLPDSILEDPMESISSMKIIEGACSLIKNSLYPVISVKFQQKSHLPTEL